MADAQESAFDAGRVNMIFMMTWPTQQVAAAEGAGMLLIEADISRCTGGAAAASLRLARALQYLQEVRIGKLKASAPEAGAEADFVSARLFQDLQVADCGRMMHEAVPTPLRSSRLETSARGTARCCAGLSALRRLERRSSWKLLQSPAMKALRTACCSSCMRLCGLRWAADVCADAAVQEHVDARKRERCCQLPQAEMQVAAFRMHRTMLIHGLHAETMAAARIAFKR